MGVRLERMQPGDWPAVEAIYREGIETGNATFEVATPGWDDFDAGHRAECRWVARDDAGGVLGWAALASVSPRPVYRGVAEVSLYVAAEDRGNRVGRALLDRLVDASESEGVWTLRAGIFPENAPSIALHQAVGFRQVGVFERVGRMQGSAGDAGRWRDVVVFERHSKRAGLD